jgi:hypothetical protein
LRGFLVIKKQPAGWRALHPFTQKEIVPFVKLDARLRAFELMIAAQAVR